MPQPEKTERKRSMTFDRILNIALIAIIVVLTIKVIYTKPVVAPPVVVPVYIDRTDTIRIETIKNYINNYTREPERIFIYQADAGQLDSVIRAQLGEITKRGW